MIMSDLAPAFALARKGRWRRDVEKERGGGEG